MGEVMGIHLSILVLSLAVALATHLIQSLHKRVMKLELALDALAPVQEKEDG